MARTVVGTLGALAGTAREAVEAGAEASFSVAQSSVGALGVLMGLGCGGREV